MSPEGQDGVEVSDSVVEIVQQCESGLAYVVR